MQVLQYVLTHGVGIPPGPAEQVPRPAPGFNPREPARYPAHHDLERLPPADSVYAVTRGYRMIFSLHTR